MEENSDFTLILNGQGLKSIVLPWKCHSGRIMELCDDCNNCAQFQFFEEKSSVNDMAFFVILSHFVSSSHLICGNENLE